MRLIAAAALLAFTVANAVAATAGGQGTGFRETSGPIAVGQAAPPIAGEDLDGRKIEPERFRGRPVFMDFSSIFCPSCQETIREFRRLQEAYKDTDLELVVVVDGDTPPKALKSFFAQSGARYTVVRAPENLLFERFGVDSIPFQVAIDRKGIIRKIHVGFDPGMEGAMGLEALAERTPAGK
jgi:peroxiredoxin